MNISKISSAQNLPFKAKVTVNAPEKLLSKEDKKYFESLGPSIGNESDSFEVSISDLKPSAINPSVLVYQCTQRYVSPSNPLYTKSQSIPVPYVKDGKTMEDKSPKVYLQRIFDRLIEK